MLKSTFVILFLFGFGLKVANGIYFKLNVNEEKCLLQDLEEDALLIIDYKVEQYDVKSKIFTEPQPGYAVKVEIGNAEGKIVFSREYGIKGQIPFTAPMSSVFKICLTIEGAKNYLRPSQFQLHCNTRTGVQAIDYSSVAKKEKLSELQLRIRQLMDQVQQISRQQNYQRHREERFRYTSESTRSRVFWWPFIQIFVVISIGLWQMMHLKRFFLMKKLV